MKKRDETPKRIIDAFLSLYAQIPFEQITIKYITQSIGISRGTFYLHFFNLDDLLPTIEDEHLEAIRSINNKQRRYYLSREISDLKQYYNSTLKYIEANRGVFRVLLSSGSRSRFKEELKQIMRGNVRLKYESAMGDNKWDEYKTYIIDIIVAGNIGIISNWVSTENSRNSEDVANLFGDILLNLPYMNLRDALRRE
jgi:AcrR family transcriptional regulator